MPEKLEIPYPKVKLPRKSIINNEMLQAPLPANKARLVELVKGPNIATLPALHSLPMKFIVLFCSNSGIIFRRMI